MCIKILFGSPTPAAPLPIKGILTVCLPEQFLTLSQSPDKQVHKFDREACVFPVSSSAVVNAVR